jgi:hypothetical protein
VHFENDMPSARLRTSTSKGVAKTRAPKRAPPTQAEKDAQKERLRVAREEKKALDERISKMGMLEYTNFVAEQEQEAAAEKERKKQAACARRAEQKLREAQEFDEARTRCQRALASKYDGTAGVKCVLCTRFCARAVECMRNHKTGRLVECQRCDLCKEEIESKDPALHSTCRDVLWTEWIDAHQTPATRKKRDHEKRAKEALHWLEEEGARLFKIKNAKIEHKRLRLEQRDREELEMKAHPCPRTYAPPVHDLLDAESHDEYMWRWMQLNPDWSMEEVNTDERCEFNQQRAHVTSLLRSCFPELIERVTALERDKLRREKEIRKAKREKQKQARGAWLVRPNARNSSAAADVEMLEPCREQSCES